MYTFLAAGLASAFLLFTTYYTLGLKIFLSNLMLLGLYAFIVPCIFFTYGAWIEKLIIDKQINGLVDELESDVNNYGTTIPPININVDKSQDDSVEEDNKKLLESAFIVVTIFTFLVLAVTYFLKRYLKDPKEYKTILYENLVILFFIVIVELLFFGFITRKYRTLDSNTIISLTLRELGEKFKE